MLYAPAAVGVRTIVMKESPRHRRALRAPALALLTAAFLLNTSCNGNMLCGKEIRTSKVLSEGYRAGSTIYFLCDYRLSEPGTTVIPMYIATPVKIHYHKAFMYSFDTADEKLTKRAALTPASPPMGGGDVKYVRWAADGPLIYLMYITGWDKTTKKPVYGLFRYDTKMKSAVEVTGDEKETLVLNHFSGSFSAASRKNSVPFTKVWYHAGGLPLSEWGLPSPPEYRKLNPRQCVDLIVEQRGDRYLREAAFEMIKPSLTEKEAKKMIDAMDKRHAKLSDYQRMTYAPCREEWTARIALHGRYGTARENNTLEAALFRNDRERVSAFLKNSPDVNRRDDGGRTPLMVAACADNTEGIEKLLNRGADINARDDAGRTPLFYAVTGNAPNALELLLKRGADPKLETRSGWNVWMFVANTELRRRYLENTEK